MAKWGAQLTRTTYIMASEVFLAVFHAHFDAHYDALNESCLRWWINERIRDFIAPTFICGNMLQACTVQHEGHHPKVLLWIMEEFFYISHNLTEQDRNGRIVLSYELMIEAEHWYRVKRGGGMGCHHSSQPSGNTPPCSRDTLERIAWSELDSKNIRAPSMVSVRWSSITRANTKAGQAPRLITKLLGDWPPKYSGVCKYVAQQGHQHSLMNRSQWGRYSLWYLHNPQVKVQERQMLRKCPPKSKSAEEGAVGGDAEVDMDPDTHPMAWMRNSQHCYDDEMISFWPLLRPLMDGGGTTMWCLARRLLSTWEWSSATHPTSCPPAPTNMGDRMVATPR